MASVKFRLKSPKNPETSIIVRFYCKQTGPLDFSTGETIPPEFWQGQRVSSKYKKQSDRINKHLSRIEGELLDLWRDHKGASKEELTRLVTQVVKGTSTAQKKTVIEAVKLFIAQYEREKEKTTVGRYRVLLNKLEKFNADLTFEQLDHNFYDAFKNFLYSSPNPVYSGHSLVFDSDSGTWIVRPDKDARLYSNDRVSSVGLMDDVVFKYIVQIKTICGWAGKRGYSVNPSYKAFEIIKREYPIISLTLDEVQQIEALTGLPSHLEIARDYLSICCRTGQRISDVKRISALSISSGTWQIFQKKGSRQKQKIVELPLKGFCAPVVDIVNKYGGKLPELSEQKINTHIKTICEKAKIDQEIYIERWAGSKKIRIPGKKYEYISCHVGKKTFISILASKGTPLSILSDFTGTSQKTIEKHYLGKAPLYVAESYLEKIEEKSSTLKKVV
jgi:hypothetical protein